MSQLKVIRARNFQSPPNHINICITKVLHTSILQNIVGRLHVYNMLIVVSKGLLPKKHTPNITFLGNVNNKKIKKYTSNKQSQMATPIPFVVDINNDNDIKLERNL